MTLAENLQILEQRRVSNAEAIAAAETQIKKMTKKGCQAGTAHFKTDRPNTMYILEPSVNGRRKYVHVGTDPEQQEKKRKEVQRYSAREQLMNIVASWQRETARLDALVEQAAALANAIKKDTESWSNRFDQYL